jgi:hypothetical protein
VVVRAPARLTLSEARNLAASKARGVAVQADSIKTRFLSAYGSALDAII